MDWLTERNIEQILGMQDLLDLFDQNKIALHSLVSFLTGKRNGMLAVDEQWDIEFQSRWLQLEISNALVFEALETRTTTDHSKRIILAVQNMRQFLSGTLAEKSR